jgi:hypothetical protein
LEICGGIIGTGENKKFCMAHPSQCDHHLTHAKRKFEIVPDTLYIMSSKKGGMHATLLPTLSGICIPADKALVDLLSNEIPITMWHVYFDKCKTAEEATGQNELEAPKDLLWDAVKHPSLEVLERANNFKTPRKVQVMPEFVKVEVDKDFKLVTLGKLIFLT